MDRLLTFILVLTFPCIVSSQPDTAAEATSTLRELYERAYLIWLPGSYYSSKVPSIEAVQELVARGADVNCALPYRGVCPLHVAVLMKLPHHVEALLKAPNIDVNKKRSGDHKDTPLSDALDGDFCRIGQMLLEAGADADARFFASVSGQLLSVTPLLYAALMRPHWIPVLGPYVQVDMVFVRPSMGSVVRATELAMVVDRLRNSGEAKLVILYLLAEGASVDKLPKEHQQLMHRILGSDFGTSSNAVEHPIRATSFMRWYETLKDIKRLKQMLSRLPADLPPSAFENMDHALLNAVRNELEEAAYLLYQAGASRELALKWLNLHQTGLSLVQRRLLEALQPSRILTALHREPSSLVSLLPADIIRLIVPLTHGRALRLTGVPSVNTAASAAL